MQPLEQFLSNFEKGLARLRHRIKSGERPARMFDRDSDIAPKRDEIWVGVGDLRSASASPPTKGIWLNNKAAGHLSVTDLVRSADAPVLSGWRAILANGADIEQFFDRVTLVVEDASPDSCFALLLVVARTFGSDEVKLPSEWVDYVRGWEMGDIMLTDGPPSAYGCLHNALVHQTIDVNPSQAWFDGLTLLVQVLASGQMPTGIDAHFRSSAMTAARAHLAFEQQLYEDSLRQLTPIQLAVPMTGSATRRRLVDAYLGEEGVLPVGALKAFARSDRTHPSLKNGYSVMALFRPFEEGSGNDITISVDTSTGIDLRKLWCRLEQLEDERWGESRPCDRSRRGISAYPEGKRANGTNAPNEPWYDGGDYTLLGAPRRLKSEEPGKAGPLGSKLSWTDVKEQLWATYQPFRDVLVRAGAAVTVCDHAPAEVDLRTLDQCVHEIFSDVYLTDRSVTEPRLIVAGWFQRNNAELAFRTTPTFYRYLAACLKRPSAVTRVIQLADLPSEDSYDVVEFSNGAGIVCEEGAFLVDAGRPSKLPVEALKVEFERARRILHRVESAADRIAKLVRSTKAYIDGQQVEFSDLDLLHNLTGEQIDVAIELYQARVAKAVPEAKHLRDTLMTRWRIDGKMEALAHDVRLIKELLHSHTELIKGRRFVFLQTYGLPLVVAAALCGFTFEKLEIDWQPQLGGVLTWPFNHGVKWYGLLLFVLLSALGAAAIRIYSAFDEKQSRRQRKSMDEVDE